MPWGPPPPPPPRGAKNLEKANPQKPWFVSHNFVTPGYFAAFALPVRAGRDFSVADDSSAPRVAIVNETLAARAFGQGESRSAGASRSDRPDRSTSKSSASSGTFATSTSAKPRRTEFSFRSRRFPSRRTSNGT